MNDGEEITIGKQNKTASQKRNERLNLILWLKKEEKQYQLCHTVSPKNQWQ